LVEHLLCKQGVVGSSPITSTDAVSTDPGTATCRSPWRPTGTVARYRNAYRIGGPELIGGLGPMLPRENASRCEYVFA
jgi:hypothetical protein